MSRAILLAVAGASLLAAAPAAAQTPHSPELDWRRIDRTEALRSGSSSQAFAFEFRFGPYYPEIDQKPGLTPLSYYGGGQKPYEYVFGADKKLYFGVEMDYLPLRIPYVGVIGPGLGWGFTRASEAAKYSSDHLTPSGQDTSFTIMPMHLSAVLRLDELMRRTGIPIVPYGKFGLGMGIWLSSDEVPATGANAMSNKDGTPVNVASAGVSWGYHAAVGGMLALNFLDPRSAAKLDEATGVNHAYFFGEWMRAGLNGLKSTPTFYLGASTWVVGFALDM